MLRFFIADRLSKFDFEFPWATLTANFLASLILGYFLAQAIAGHGTDVKKALIMTGFCGGFSTFSTFSVESFQLLQDGNYTYAFLNMAVSILVCLLGVLIGYKLGA